MISSSAAGGSGAGTSTSSAAGTASLKEVSSAPVAAAPLVAALPTTLSVAAIGGSSSPNDCFTSLFPSYSHNMFSNLLDGDLLDEELNSLLNFSSDPPPPPAVATEADSSSAGSPPADPVVDPATAPATSSSSTGENDEDEHPGLLVARTAAALDGNPVVGEPFFFCTNSETATATQPQAQPSPPQVQASTGRIISTADPLQKIYPKKPPGTTAGQKRAAADLPVPDTLASMTKTMLKKARKITFQSSCGPANTSTTTVAEAAKPTVAAQPAASTAPQDGAGPTGTTTATTCNSERISNKSVSIVDALIHTLQSSSSNSTNGPSSGVQEGESQNAPQEHAGSASSAAPSGASSPPELAQDTQAAVMPPPSQAAAKREPVPIQPAPPTAVVKPLPPSSTTTTEAIPIQPAPPQAQAQAATVQVMIAPAPDAVMSSSTTVATYSDSSVASTTAAVPATSTSDATVVSAEQPPKKKTGGRRPISCELQEVPPEYRKRTRHLSAEEKSEISRNRNRIHARNTRLRKKAYIDDLKKTVNDLVDERDAQRAWQERQAKIVKQNRSVRLMVMEHFLKLHATTTTTADADDAAMKKRWETLLKEDVMICFPSYRQQPEQLQQPATATGIVNVMTAAKSFVSKLRDTCGDPNLGLSFECDRKSFLMDGATAAVEVTLKVRPSNSDKPELSLIGSLRTSFCVQTNKIQSSRLLIDFGSRLEHLSASS